MRSVASLAGVDLAVAVFVPEASNQNASANTQDSGVANAGSTVADADQRFWVAAKGEAQSFELHHIAGIGVQSQLAFELNRGGGSLNGNKNDTFIDFTQNFPDGDDANTESDGFVIEVHNATADKEIALTFDRSLVAISATELTLHAGEGDPNSQ